MNWVESYSASGCSSTWPESTGVYAIVNNKSKKVYVGSASRSFCYRWKIHRTALRRGTHKNSHLQLAWNKYGERNFVFTVLEGCPPDLCVDREQYWLDRKNSADRRYGYNISLVAGSVRGLKHSEKTKENLRRLSRSQWRVMSEEDRRELSKKLTGRKHSEEAKAKISAAGLGRRHSINTRKRMSLVQKILGVRNKTEEHRAKLRAAWVSRKLRGPTQKEIEGHRKKSISLLGRKRTEEQRARMSASQRGKIVSEETRKKIAYTLSGRRLSEEHKAAIRNGHRRGKQ